MDIVVQVVAYMFLFMFVGGCCRWVWDMFTS